MKAVVEPHLHDPPGLLRGLHQPLDLSRPQPGRLLHQHVGARAERPLGHRRELVVGGRDDHHVGLEPEQLVDSGVRSPAVPLDQRLRALGHGVGGADHLILRSQGRRALVADQPAADDRHPQPGRAHVYSVE